MFLYAATLPFFRFKYYQTTVLMLWLGQGAKIHLVSDKHTNNNYSNSINIVHIAYLCKYLVQVVN